MELEVNNLTKEFGSFTAVNHLNITGNLAMCRAHKGTKHPHKCCFTCNGKEIFTMDGDYRKILGYLPQDFGFYPDFTVQDYLLYIASIKAIRPAVAKKRVKELLEKTGLENAVHKKMKKLSGGMKRRAGIAQAMLNDPKILVLDEPTAGLDPNERIRFRNLISELSEDRLVLLSTHIVPDVEYIANEILLMKNGSFIQRGTTEHLITTMKENIWKCHVEKSYVPQLMKKYKISNLKTDSHGAVLRIISKEKPVPDAVPEEAVLEDVFLYYFDEKAGE